jgi:DNA-binding protein HU-beta
MNKAELITAVSIKGEMSKKDAEKAIETVFGTIEEALENHESVKLVGFGTFSVKDRDEKNGRNPQTGESIVIPAKSVPVFKAGSELKSKVLK